VSEQAPTCPKCRAELQLSAGDKLHTWSCPNGHGLGFTISIAYDRLQDDEIHKIWHDSETAPPGTYDCPMCSRRMVAVTVAVGDPGSPEETLDVCRSDEFMWFDAGELDEFPEHVDPPPPSAEELQKIEQIRETFDREYLAGMEAGENRGVMNKFANHVVKHHPGLVNLLDHAVYGHKLDDLEGAPAS
jgi:Zn-finger nucleic acid-binding protein